jgi:hypothetical protein
VPAHFCEEAFNFLTEGNQYQNITGIIDMRYRHTNLLSEISQ